MLIFFKNLKKTAKQQLIGITVVIVGLFIILKNMPSSECGFLHYEVTEVSADGIEICKADVGAFLDLEKLEFPVKGDIIGENKPQKDIQNKYTLMLRLNGGKILMPRDIMLSHTQKVHLLIIDESLEDYQHIHPVGDETTGQWTFEFTPKKSGEYMVFADMVPVKTKKNLVTKTTINIPREESAFVFRPGDTYQWKDYVFKLKIDSGRIEAKQRSMITLLVENTTNKNIQLEPIMGAYAHLVAFDKDLKGLAHLHPIADIKPLDTKRPELNFYIQLQNRGLYRLWAQMKIENEQVFVPFDIDVKE